MSQGYKSSCINQYSCDAEREDTLSHIDSALYNGEISKAEARDRMIQWAVDNGGEAMLPGLMANLFAKAE